MVPSQWYTASLALLVACAGNPESAHDAPVVKVMARQWSFDPPTIGLRKGVAVNLEMTSLDVHHRFYLPDFGLDVDLVPGMTSSISFTPDRAGTFRFRCEYYCGQGHEGMVGHVVVQ